MPNGLVPMLLLIRENVHRVSLILHVDRESTSLLLIFAQNGVSITYMVFYFMCSPAQLTSYGG
jgi:hypothetical protein